MATLTALPQRVRADATALLVFLGPGWRAVEWTLAGGGLLTPLSAYTDKQGRAYALYRPGVPGETVTVTVSYGA